MFGFSLFRPFLPANSVRRNEQTVFPKPRQTGRNSVSLALSESVMLTCAGRSLNGCGGKIRKDCAPGWEMLFFHPAFPCTLLSSARDTCQNMRPEHLYGAGAREYTFRSVSFRLQLHKHSQMSHRGRHREKLSLLRLSWLSCDAGCKDVRRVEFL